MEKIKVTELHKLSDPLEATDIDFKPGFVNRHGDVVYCSLLAYKDARVDMHVLDTVVGQDRWQNLYQRDSKGTLQCGIGIKCENEWVWKWSNGTPSQFECDRDWETTVSSTCMTTLASL